MANIQKHYNSMGLPMNINRSNPIPVDCTELWYSLEDAQNYALNDPRAYVGQSIKVVNESTGDITWYMIGVDGSLVNKINELNDTIDGIVFPVTSVNGKTGEIELTASDVGAISTEDQILSDQVVHSIAKMPLSTIIETYVLTIDYNQLLAFDTTEIVFDENTNSSTSAVLGKAILGQMVLG